MGASPMLALGNIEWAGAKDILSHGRTKETQLGRRKIMKKYVRIYDVKPGNGFNLVEEAEIDSLTPEQFEELVLKYANKTYLHIYIYFDVDSSMGNVPEKTPYKPRNFDIPFHEIVSKVLGEGETGNVFRRIKLAHTKSGLEKIMSSYR